MKLFSNSKILKSSLFKTGAKYSAVSTTSSIVEMLVGLVMMFWLLPEQIGKWNAVSIFIAYLPFLQLGIQSGLSVELPIKLGNNDDKQAKILISNGFAFAILISIIITLVGVILTFVYYFNYGLDLALGIVTITIVGVTSSFKLHFVARFRSAGAFDNLTKIIFINIPITISLVYFIYRFDYLGILIYNSVKSIAFVGCMVIYLPYKEVKPKFSKSGFIELLKTGIALLIPNNISNAAQTIPKWIILTKSTVETLGLYTPAIAVNSLISLLPNQIAQFFHPQMGYLYGQTKKASSMWPYVKKMNIYMPLAALVIAAGIWLLAPWGLRVFFPKYIESLWAMRIMCIAFVFSAAGTTRVVFFTIHEYLYAYIVSVLDCVGCFVFPYLFTYIIPQDILTSVSLGLAINSVLKYVLTFILLKKALLSSKYN